MSARPILFALAAIVLTAPVAQSQYERIDTPWMPDARLASGSIPAAYSGDRVAAPVTRTSMSRGRHAVASVLAGAMVGILIGVLETPNGRLGCAVPEGDPDSICSPSESSDRPMLIGGVLGATVGLLYHLSWRRQQSANQ